MNDTKACEVPGLIQLDPLTRRTSPSSTQDRGTHIRTCPSDHTSSRLAKVLRNQETPSRKPSL